jgi:hypothetical protein
MHRKAIDMIKADWTPAFIAGSVGAFATPEDSQRLRDELNSLLEEFFKNHRDATNPDAVPVAITFAVLPSRAEDVEGWAGERVFEWRGR